VVGVSTPSFIGIAAPVATRARERGPLAVRYRRCNATTGGPLTARVPAPARQRGRSAGPARPAAGSTLRGTERPPARAPVLLPTPAALRPAVPAGSAPRR